MNERDRRRAKRRRKAGKDYQTVDLGNGVVQARPDEVMRAMGGLPPDLDWAVLAPRVVPILPRRRAMPPSAGSPVRVTLPPGIPVGFGIDIGPAFLIVGESLLGDWGITTAGVVATALENLRRLVRPLRPRDLHVEVIDGVPVRILQSGSGCASCLVLVPDEVERLFGDAPQLLLAPMRDVLVSLPADVDRAFAEWLNEEFVAMDPNGLSLDGFVLQDGALRYEPFRPLGPRSVLERYAAYDQPA
jgi:hypothetical protein